ncbi:hypothetical protein FQN49_002274 [Arthroderma sp. PD_2]|nr:hypothetical protein FQN49_002274 [Arthroderma sp. PD_2]
MPRRREGCRPIRTRTRSGCQPCRASKVKCDETKPACLRCREKGLSCRPVPVNLKWESDFLTRGLAFGRSKKPKKSRSSGDESMSASPDGYSISQAGVEEQEWCVVPTIEAWHFVNCDMVAFEQPNLIWAQGREGGLSRPLQDDGGSSRTEVMRLKEPPSSSRLERSLSLFPSLQGPRFFEYYVHQVCPRTTPSSRSSSPFASLVIPFCLTASSMVFKAIQALGAFHWSKSDPSWIVPALSLKSEVLTELRLRISPSSTTIITMDEDLENLVTMMMLCLCEITDNDGNNQQWTVHLRGSKDIIRLRREHHQNSVTSTSSQSIDSFATLFFAFQDVIGRTACGDTPLFGTDCWKSDEHTVDLWMGCSPELASILVNITELSRSRRGIFSTTSSSSSSQATTFTAQADALKRRLDHLVQIVDDDRDDTLRISAELKRLATILYLHCALYGASPSTPLVVWYARQILYLVSALLRCGVVASLAWPVFVAAVELDLHSSCSDGDALWADEHTGSTVYGRPLVLEALAAMATSNLSNVTLMRAVVVKVWHARDINGSTSGSSSDSPVDSSAGIKASRCNDWEWYVAPVSAGLSLA